MEKLESERKQKLADLKRIYKELDRQIDILKEKDDKIGKVEGDPATVRAKETLIEVALYLQAIDTKISSYFFFLGVHDHVLFI